MHRMICLFVCCVSLINYHDQSPRLSSLEFVLFTPQCNIPPVCFLSTRCLSTPRSHLVYENVKRLRRSLEQNSHLYHIEKKKKKVWNLHTFLHHKSKKSLKMIVLILHKEKPCQLELFTFLHVWFS